MSRVDIKELDAMTECAAIDLLRSCCGSKTWCRAMTSRRPFSVLSKAHQIADQIFDSLSREDWLEAFSCHPKIGDLDSLRMRYAGNREWSKGEQAGVSNADEQTIQGLADGNARYESKFGYIFIICASGLTAAEMLTKLHARLSNTEEDELQNAATEQRKITHLRIDKLCA